MDDWTNGGRLDLLLDACKAIADDWANGGRLDLLIDAGATAVNLEVVKTVVDGIASSLEDFADTDDLGDVVTTALSGVVTALAYLVSCRKGLLTLEDDTPSAGLLTEKVYDENTDGLLSTHVITKASGNRAKAT